jgi:hypothetical protein
MHRPAITKGGLSMKKLFLGLCLFCCALSFTGGCMKEKPAAITDMKEYPLDSLEGILTREGITLDKAVSADGNGSLKIAAGQPVTVRLYETGDIDVENARILYQAKVKTENLDGKAYIEMWCHFPGKGEYYSRALQPAVSGTMDWVTQETPFFLKPGENPDNVKLNLVIEGKGTVWIDDISLVKGPLS